MSKKEQTKQENLTNFTGSESTYKMVAKQIKQRFGEKSVADYDPRRNCKSFKSWLEEGYKVKRGEKALKSITFIEKKESDGSIKKYPKKISLFFYLQVEKLTK